MAFLAALVCLWAPWPWIVRLALLALLLLLAMLAYRRLSNSVHSLRLAGDGLLSVRFNGQEQAYFPMLLKSGATVHPWLTVLRLQYEAHPLNLIITPDSIDPDDFRRLRVWLKWRAIYGRPDGDD